MSSELENGSVENLRMQIKDAGGHRSESARIGDRLSRMVTEMMAAQGEILDLEAQLVAAEAVKTALTREKLKSEELERTVAELKETNLQLREAAANREAEMQNLEKELAEKDALVEKLKLELRQTKELNLSSEKIASETIADLNHKTGKMKAELDEIRSQADRILESEVENALLKVELHKWRSKAAAAEAAVERCKREIFALNRALQLTAASQQASSSINNVTISRNEYEALSNKADEQDAGIHLQPYKLHSDLTSSTMHACILMKTADGDLHDLGPISFAHYIIQKLNIPGIPIRGIGWRRRRHFLILQSSIMVIGERKPRSIFSHPSLSSIYVSKEIYPSDLPNLEFEFGLVDGVGVKILTETLGRMVEKCKTVFVDIQALIRVFDPSDGTVGGALRGYNGGNEMVLRGGDGFWTVKQGTAAELGGEATAPAWSNRASGELLQRLGLGSGGGR
nr:inositol 3-kinase [Ipomoea batatas]